VCVCFMYFWKRDLPPPWLLQLYKAKCTIGFKIFCHHFCFICTHTQTHIHTLSLSLSLSLSLRVSRWALRCVACFFVTKEAGRLFCPRCGNAALERVEVMVSPEGTEFFGVKKNHVLRGTRYSLPKPRVGNMSRFACVSVGCGCTHFCVSYKHTCLYMHVFAFAWDCFLPVCL